MNLAQVDGGAGGFGVFLPLIALFLIMYALVIRPQQRQQKQHKAMLAEIQKSDQIVTSGGVYGKVVGISDDVLTVEIAERVRVKIDRSAVTRRVLEKKVEAAEPEKRPAAEKKG